MTAPAVPILSLLLVLSLAALAWTNRDRLLRRSRGGEALRQDIAGAIALGHSEGAVEKEDRDRLLGALDLSERTVEEIMRHRSDIEMIDAAIPADQILTRAVQSAHTRLPVFRDDPENIVGVLHAKDLLRALHANGGSEGLDVLKVARKPYFVPETTNLKSLLHDMQSRKIHLVIALDEYGGTAGMITMEDVLEQIVGEIGDEYDALRPEDVQEMPDGSQIVSGRVSLDEVNELFGLDLTSELVESIGGHLSEIAGRIPAVGESFDLGRWRFQVHEADAKHIESLRVLRAE